MAWILLYLAGVFEVIWAGAMKASLGFSKSGWSALTALAALVSFWLLALAMRDLPLGTAYAVWIGIGAVGAFIVGVMFMGETLSPVRVGSVALIVAGLIGLKLSSSGA
ncbi:MAG: multidrug efflux SMR transporter [Aliishimia sp.]